MSRPKSQTRTTATKSRDPKFVTPKANDAPSGRAAPQDDDDIPENIDEFRLELARRIRTFIGFWHDCPRPICQRTKACNAWCEECAGKPDEPPMTEEERQAEWDRVRLEVRQALRAHFIEQGLNPDDPEEPLDPDQSRPGRAVR